MAENESLLLQEDASPYTYKEDLAPADCVDPVIEAYKKDVDRTLLRENLKLTTNERSQKFRRFMELAWELRRHAERERAKYRT